MDGDFGVSASVFGEDATEEMAGGGTDVTDAEFALFALGGATDGFEGGLVLLEEGAGFAEENGAGIGETHSLAVPVEEEGIELVFHLLDGATEGGLGDAQAGGGFGEAEFFGDGDEVSQLAEVHVIAKRYKTDQKSLFLLQQKGGRVTVCQISNSRFIFSFSWR